MSTPWWELSLDVDKASEDDACAALVEAGASAVEVIADAVGAPDSGGMGASALSATSSERVRLVAGFPGRWEVPAILDTVREAFTPLGLVLPADLRVTSKAATDWAVAYKAWVKPLQVGARIWIVPAWETSFVPPPGSLVITQDPGMAFGTGQHATTAMCLEIMEQALRVRPVHAFLDVGCGSGILAIAAARLGARSVTALDHDDVAVRTATDNVIANGLEPQIRVVGNSLAEMSAAFDWVVANILAPTLVTLAAPILARCASGGTLLLAGMLEDQTDEVLAAYRLAARSSARTITEVGQSRKEDWVALLLSLI